jgi:hypothetical protein
MVLSPLLAALEKDFKGGDGRTDEDSLKGDARLLAVRILKSMGPEANTPAVRKVLLGLAEGDPVAEVKSEAKNALQDIRSKE